MIIARWTIDARFGHKQAALELMSRWWRDIAPQIGWSADQARILTGSLGAPESTIQVEVALADLGALHRGWTGLGRASGQEAWAEALEPHIVSGTARWEVYRVV